MMLRVMNRIEAPVINDEKITIAYTPQYRGQCAYIAYRCSRSHLRIYHADGRIMIPEGQDLRRISRIVEESIAIRQSLSELPVLHHKSKSFYDGRALLCVMLRDVDETFLTEGHLDEVVRLQFLGAIPVTMNYRVFSRQWAMKESLISRGILV